MNGSPSAVGSVCLSNWRKERPASVVVCLVPQDVVYIFDSLPMSASAKSDIEIAWTRR